jgi:8-oxo-dGTP pyrophosphatase MutT (NUDIX family)
LSYQIDLTLEQIKARLYREMAAETNHLNPEFPQLLDILPDVAKPAAVLIPLQRIQGQWYVLFTRRNAKLLEHSGQVAFPGGRSDPQDPDPETTALRETWEEIGIKPSDVEVLGRLPSLLTITNYLVTPIVGNIPYPYIFLPAIDEVSRIFTIPLDWLADPANHEIRQRVLPAPFDPVSVIYFHEYDGEILWGATARFTMCLLKILYQMD